MLLNLDEKDLSRLIIIGDRILIKPRSPQSKTKSGLYLPPGVPENEKVQIGYVIKTGPGYPIPSVSESEEPWKKGADDPKFIPLQAREGDMAVYLLNSTVEIEFNKEKYLIVPQAAVLLLLRDDGLFE